MQNDALYSCSIDANASFVALLSLLEKLEKILRLLRVTLVRLFVVLVVCESADRPFFFFDLFLLL
jgi:hypothetical protein